MLLDDSLMGLDTCQVWDTDTAFQHLLSSGLARTKRTAERRIIEYLRPPPPLSPQALVDEQGLEANPLLLNWVLEKSRQKRRLVIFACLHRLPDGRPCILANDARKGRYWIPLPEPQATPAIVHSSLSALQAHLGKASVLLPSGELVALLRRTEPIPGLEVSLAPYHQPCSAEALASPVRTTSDTDPYLQALEAESIFIIREALAIADRPALLHAMGKDSCVLSHLVRKAVHPGQSRLSLLYVRTGQELYETAAFRRSLAQISALPLTILSNPGTGCCPRAARPDALMRALGPGEYDLVLSGRRRDEEPSNATLPIFSLYRRGSPPAPLPVQPEFRRIANLARHPDETFHVCPMANWTELDVWRYIRQEGIAVVPLYFARRRPLVIRDGIQMIIDDGSFQLLSGEEIVEKTVCVRSLGDYPMTGTIDSTAGSIDEILMELLQVPLPEKG